MLGPDDEEARSFKASEAKEKEHSWYRVYGGLEMRGVFSKGE